MLPYVLQQSQTLIYLNKKNMNKFDRIRPISYRCLLSERTPFNNKCRRTNAWTARISPRAPVYEWMSNSTRSFPFTHSISHKPIIQWICIITKLKFRRKPSFTKRMNGWIIRQKTQRLLKKQNIQYWHKIYAFLFFLYRSNGQGNLIALGIQLQAQTISMTFDIIIWKEQIDQIDREEQSGYLRIISAL